MKNPVFKINERGEWYYNNSLISRKSLIKLFSKVLVRYNDGTFHLKTPVEDFEIFVFDVPFFIVNAWLEISNNKKIIMETNVGDIIELGKSNPLWIENNSYSNGLVPYVLVRSGIAAKVSRSVYYDLASFMVEKKIKGLLKNVLESNDCFFEMDLEKNRKDFIGYK